MCTEVATMKLVLLHHGLLLRLNLKAHTKATVKTTEIPMAEAPNPTQISMMRRPKAFLMTGSLVCLPCRGKR